MEALALQEQPGDEWAKGVAYSYGAHDLSEEDAAIRRSSFRDVCVGGLGRGGRWLYD